MQYQAVGCVQVEQRSQAQRFTAVGTLPLEAVLGWGWVTVLRPQLRGGYIYG